MITLSLSLPLTQLYQNSWGSCEMTFDSVIFPQSPKTGKKILDHSELIPPSVCHSLSVAFSVALCRDTFTDTVHVRSCSVRLHVRTYIRTVLVHVNVHTHRYKIMKKFIVIISNYDFYFKCKRLK